MDSLQYAELRPGKSVSLGQLLKFFDIGERLRSDVPKERLPQVFEVRAENRLGADYLPKDGRKHQLQLLVMLDFVGQTRGFRALLWLIYKVKVEQAQVPPNNEHLLELLGDGKNCSLVIDYPLSSSRMLTIARSKELAFWHCFSYYPPS